MALKRPDSRDAFDLTSLPMDVQTALYQSDDRSTVLVGACLVEKALTELLAAAVLGSRAELKDLFEAPGAPLQTFSSKIRAAHAFGLISAREKHDLNLVREVRNDFAHNILGCDFNDPTVVAHCSKFQLYPARLRASQVRKQFIQEVGLLLGILPFRSRLAVRATSPADFSVGGE